MVVGGWAGLSQLSFIFLRDANQQNENQNDRDSRQYFPNEHAKNIRAVVVVIIVYVSRFSRRIPTPIQSALFFVVLLLEIAMIRSSLESWPSLTSAACAC
jgi:predicted membrane-bound dolichyl-phosphate-mannose-protein mannosyltransferase